MARKLEVALKPSREKNKAATQAKPGNDGRRPTGPANFAAPEDKGETRAKVADALGVSHETLRKTRAVVDAAAKPDAPPEVKQAKESMDQTGKVDPAVVVEAKIVDENNGEHGILIEGVPDLEGVIAECPTTFWKPLRKSLRRVARG